MTAPHLRSREAILAVLEGTASALAGLTDSLGPDKWRQVPAPGEWAMVELACHLRDTERDVHAMQLTVLLESEEPFVPRPEAAYWAQERRYLEESGPDALQDFAASRSTTLERLGDVPDETWEKPARHAIFGPTSFLEVIGFMAEHDDLHLQQARRIRDVVRR
jgi:hypothetical protein